MAQAHRGGGVYLVGARMEKGKLTGGRWLDANGKPADAPTKDEQQAHTQVLAEAEQAAEAVAAQLAGETPAARRSR